MKLLNLRFKNLNSLYGQWNIDFTAQEFQSHSIFALTGPTGAGKSTILDAVCLALYGETPRLGRITKSQNEIMSRKTGECSAEVIFETKSGRFRCSWEQHRAHKKIYGNLTEPSHEIADAESNKLLASQKRKVLAAVIEKTGMDFDQFTRSILLAQGSFDTFLKAPLEEKSMILEQITGTEIYTDISLAVHLKYKEENDKYRRIQEWIDRVNLLPDEDVNEVEKNLASVRMEEQSLTGLLEKNDKATAWKSMLLKLEVECRNLEKEKGLLEDEVNQFLPQRIVLNRALKAVNFDAEYAILKNLLTQLEADRQAILAIQEKQPQQNAEFQKVHQVLMQAELSVLNSKKDYEKVRPVIQMVRLLDQQLSDKKKDLADILKGYEKTALTIEHNREKQSEQQALLLKLLSQLDQNVAYQNEHACDEWLISGLEGLKERFKNVALQNEKIDELENLLTSLRSGWSGYKAKLKALQRQKDACSLKVKNLQIHRVQMQKYLEKLLAGELLREIKTRLKTLQEKQILMAKIAGLEEMRAQLEDGKVCPLCGSKAHPFSHENVPAPNALDQEIQDVSERIHTIESTEKERNDAENLMKELQAKLLKIELEEKLMLSEQENAVKRGDQCKEDIKILEKDLDTMKMEALLLLQPLGIQSISSDLQAILRTLESRLLKWKQNLKNKVDWDHKIIEQQNLLKQTDAEIRMQLDALKKIEQNKNTAQKDLEGFLKKRSELFGDKNPDQEEKQCLKKMNHSENMQKLARDKYHEMKNLLERCAAELDSLQKKNNENTLDYEEKHPLFLARISAEGFAYEKDYRQASMPSKERNVLAEKARQLDERLLSLNTRLFERQERIINEKKLALTELSLDELKAEEEKLKLHLSELRKNISELTVKLLQNNQAKEQLKKELVKKNAQQNELERWKKLHELIGSSDGKKFRNFAQGLTFERMVSHANQQLRKMTDRYVLLRDLSNELELNVMDTWQAGEIRSTKNLSGGESFLVSLALALGLSKMSSRKVQVDSLFLDEGFGTLDEESLDTALNTLAELQEDGKLIGVISHVQALKDRIPVQIEVNRVSGGKSIISGPGCKSMADS